MSEQINVEERLEVACSSEQIKDRVKVLADKVNEHYGDSEYIVISILKGSLYFLSDLTKHLSKKIIIDFMTVSSYFGTGKNHSTKLVLDINVEIFDKKVLIVEDIIESGESIDYVLNMLKLRQPKEIKIVSLVVKKNIDQARIKPNWYGFKLENRFLVGYGLDYKNNYRNLNYIGYLRQG